MIHSEKIAKNSGSLIELLAAQCLDLEKLLVLAREETSAAQQGNFEGVLEIVTRRDEISRRLEIFQQQIAELRGHLEDKTISAALDSDISRRTIEIANLTVAQDQKTRLLLTGARIEAASELANLEKSNRGTSAYLREETRGLSYDRNF